MLRKLVEVQAGKVGERGGLVNRRHELYRLGRSVRLKRNGMQRSAGRVRPADWVGEEDDERGELGARRRVQDSS